MKKSNIFLTGAMVTALFWITLIGWFAGTSINNYVNGKDPYFARSKTQYLESRKKRFPMPVNELSISGESTMILKIVQGSELTVLCHPRLWACELTDMKEGRSMIRFTKLQKYLYYDPVTITIPGTASLVFDNFYEVTVQGMIRKSLHIQASHILHFTADSCRAETLSLDFPGKKDQQAIRISGTNLIDTLIASVNGSGNIKLEMAGKQFNRLTLSDSVRVEAGIGLMKKLFAD